jgi:hypothetical protein
VRFGRIHFGPLVEPSVDFVESRGQVTAHIEPPVTDKHGLRELGAVRAQEAGLAAVDVAVVPTCSKKEKSVKFWGEIFSN